MAQDTTYNGWTNYATWRINLELADDIVQGLAEETSGAANAFADTYELSKALQEQCEEAVTNYGELEGIAADYALAFMALANWYEIAEHAAEDYPQLIAHEEEDDDEQEST